MVKRRDSYMGYGAPCLVFGECLAFSDMLHSKNDAWEVDMGRLGSCTRFIGARNHERGGVRSVGLLGYSKKCGRVLQKHIY